VSIKSIEGEGAQGTTSKKIERPREREREGRQKEYYEDK